MHLKDTFNVVCAGIIIGCIVGILVLLGLLILVLASVILYRRNRLSSKFDVRNAKIENDLDG